MKPIRLNDEQRKDLLADMAKALSTGNLIRGEFTYKYTFPNLVNADRASVYYTSDAWLKMASLVEAYDSEIGWNALVKRLSETEFLIYDVTVYPQTVTGATVEEDDGCEYLESFTDEELDDLWYNGHSHVRMDVTPSGVDLNFRKKIVSSMKSGFYIFQILNKPGKIHTEIYDLDNNVLYENGDIDTDVLDYDGRSIKNFTHNTKKIVRDRSVRQQPVNPPKPPYLDQYKHYE